MPQHQGVVARAATWSAFSIPDSNQNSAAKGDTLQPTSDEARVGAVHRFGIQQDNLGSQPALNICGHRTLKAPHPVRSAKLSKVSPSQYCGGGPRGNPRCCSSLFLLFLAFLPNNVTALILHWQALLYLRSDDMDRKLSITDLILKTDYLQSRRH